MFNLTPEKTDGLIKVIGNPSHIKAVRDGVTVTFAYYCEQFPFIIVKLTVFIPEEDVKLKWGDGLFSDTEITLFVRLSKVDAYYAGEQQILNLMGVSVFTEDDCMPLETWVEKYAFKHEHQIKLLQLQKTIGRDQSVITPTKLPGIQTHAVENTDTDSFAKFVDKRLKIALLDKPKPDTSVTIAVNGMSVRLYAVCPDCFQDVILSGVTVKRRELVATYFCDKCEYIFIRMADEDTE